jgi:methyltransferase (TIGR00027 family)
MAIEHVSDTARWVAVYRAMESERPDRIFNDPFARRLAGDRGQTIVDEMRRGRDVAWAMIVRTAVFDEDILDVVRREKVDLVVNLACGLDARPWRLDLPSDLRWVDVDFPVMIDYKTDVLKNEKTKCRYEAISTDLTDATARTALFAKLGGESRKALIISEGLLIYLKPEQVTELATALHAQPSFCAWIIDIASPHLLKMMTKYWGKDVSGGSAPFLFAPEEGTAFFEKSGWREKSFRSNMDESRRLKRQMKGAWFWQLFSVFSSKESKEKWRRFAGTVLFERI